MRFLQRRHCEWLTAWMSLPMMLWYSPNPLGSLPLITASQSLSSHPHASLHFSLLLFVCLHILLSYCKFLPLSRARLFVTPWTAAHQAPLSMRSSRQETWSGAPFSFPGDLPESGVEPAFPASPALAGRFCVTESPGKPF